jgi:hypothetical protein
MNVEKVTTGEVRQLEKLMTSKVWHKYRRSPLLRDMTEQINYMNKAAMDIFELVRCYRVELGQTLK